MTKGKVERRKKENEGCLECSITDWFVDTPVKSLLSNHAVRGVPLTMRSIADGTMKINT